MIYHMTWLTAVVFVVSDCFSLPVMEDLLSVPKHNNNNNNNKKKTKLRQHLKKQPSALKSGRIAFVFKM